jgi:hypothetical protein
VSFAKPTTVDDFPALTERSGASSRRRNFALRRCLAHQDSLYIFVYRIQTEVSWHLLSTHAPIFFASQSNRHTGLALDCRTRALPCGWSMGLSARPPDGVRDRSAPAYGSPKGGPWGDGARPTTQGEIAGGNENRAPYPEPPDQPRSSTGLARPHNSPPGDPLGFCLPLACKCMGPLMCTRAHRQSNWRRCLP